jgi:hypothetical protein
MTTFARILLASFVFLIALSGKSSAEIPRAGGFDAILYWTIDFGDHEKPPYDVFHRAMAGYMQLRSSNKLSEKELLTIIDFRKSGNEKRLWVVDLKNKKLLYHTLVAHGRNSGELYARRFSNTPDSYQSSLGFYVTGTPYAGKHGLSLRLTGVEAGVNDKAEARAIVLHGADYVSERFIKKTGRLGRSHGCPAVPLDVHREIASLLAGKTCLFIYYPDPDYLSRTGFDHPDKNFAYHGK